MNSPLLELASVAKSFTMHNQSGAQLTVLNNATFNVYAGECVVLDGSSGMGKSTLIKMIYANYCTSAGRISVHPPDGPSIEVSRASPRALVQLRKETIGYVSQFLRVIPRVPALDIVAEPLLDDAGDSESAIEASRIEAAKWLSRLRIPEHLWQLPPATFSGGEQQRINIARNMIKPRPLLLLDEPTASLDSANTQTVIELIREATSRGAAVLGIFHDSRVGQAVATRHIDVSSFRNKP